MLEKHLSDIFKEKKNDRLTAKELLEMSDEDIENYIESLDFTDMIDLLMDVASIDAPLARVISPQACKDLNEIIASDFKTVEVKEIILFLNAVAGDFVNDQVEFFIYGVIGMLKLMYDEKKKEYKPKHAKTSTD